MAELQVGIRHVRDDVEAQSVSGAEMSVIGLIGTAPEADGSVFPLNTNILLYTNDSAMRALLGASGTLEDALKGISAQLGTDTSAARVVLRRVAEAGTVTGTIANIMGSESAETGMWGFLTAGEELGVIPRLICVPGYTSQSSGGIASVALSNNGTGYTSAPTVAFSGGGGSGAEAAANLSNGITIAITAGGTGYSTAPTITIAPPPAGGVQATATCTVATGVIDAVTVTNPGFGYTEAPVITVTGAGTAAVLTASLTGRVRSITITKPGTGYATAPTVAFSGGGGTGAAGTATVDQYGNGVMATIPTVLDRLRAVMQPEGPTSSRQAWLNWLETLPQSQRILHPLAQNAKVLDANGDTVSRPLSPYVIGRYVRRDNEFDGRPFHSVANQPLIGLVGVAPVIPFSIVDASSIGQDYIERSAGIVSRGESGVEGALTAGGFQFWGTDTLSANSSYLFAHVVRGRDYIELTQVKFLKFYLGRFNINTQTVQAIVNSMEGHLSGLRADGDILDYRVFFEPNRNLPGELRLGYLDITFQAEEPPVLRKITVRSRRFIEALEALSQQLAIQIGGADGL